MTAGRRKQKRAQRLPAIVPRFLKGAVTVGTIPTLVGACQQHPRAQPVVAYYAQPVVAAYVPDANAPDAQPPPPPPPVVAAYVPNPPPARVSDAGVDASPGPYIEQPPHITPVVVAAYVPHKDELLPPPKKPPPKKPKQSNP